MNAAASNEKGSHLVARAAQLAHGHDGIRNFRRHPGEVCSQRGGPSFERLALNERQYLRQ